MRCDTCQFWKEYDDFHPGSWESQEAGFKLCTAIKFRHDIEKEATAGIPKYPVNEPLIDTLFDDVGKRWLDAHVGAYKKEQAFVQDGSDYKGNLYTGPDFFCAKYRELKSAQSTENKNDHP